MKMFILLQFVAVFVFVGAGDPRSILVFVWNKNASIEFGKKSHDESNGIKKMSSLQFFSSWTDLNLSFKFINLHAKIENLKME